MSCGKVRGKKIKSYQVKLIALFKIWVVIKSSVVSLRDAQDNCDPIMWAIIVFLMVDNVCVSGHVTSEGREEWDL